VVDFAIDDDRRAFRDEVRRWVDAVVVPKAVELDRAERFPDEAYDGLKRLGLLGLTIPEEYGGAGADPLSYVLAVEELGRGDASVRSLVSVSLGLVAGAIVARGSEEQRERWLPAMASGELLGCFCLTEPDHGSDPASLESRAERTAGGGWRLSGRKVFITNGSRAGVALVFARSGGSGARGVSAFLVPTDLPGYAAVPVKGKLGLRATDTAEVTLDGVEVGPDALLGEEGAGLKVALGALDSGRISLAASCTGLGQACLDAMVSYATVREQFGKPIAAHQLVAELVADVAVEVEAARLLTWRAADRKARGERYTTEASMAKYYASEMSVRAASAAVQVHGGYGYVDEFPVGKYLRDARVTTLYEGTSQIQKLLIARAVTGVSAF
jgi:alkylation response protein AidB-like acyl-CoA dehydrogenase